MSPASVLMYGTFEKFLPKYHFDFTVDFDTLFTNELLEQLMCTKTCSSHHPKELLVNDNTDTSAAMFKKYRTAKVIPSKK